MPKNEFFLLVVLSAIMASFGLLANNSAAIVGSMLIAPILYSIFVLSMGVITSNFTLISISFYTNEVVKENEKIIEKEKELKVVE